MNIRTIEMAWTKDQVKDWAEWHFRGLKAIRDDEEVVISFKTDYLKTDTDETIPVRLEIFKREELNRHSNGS